MNGTYLRFVAGRRFLSLRAVFALAAIALAPAVHAAIVSSSGTVAVILSYASFGGGDFAFRISTQPAGCESGFWLSQQQPGFKSSVAFILQARATGEAVLVGGDNTQLWSGSGDHWCKVDFVGTPF